MTEWDALCPLPPNPRPTPFPLSSLYALSLLSLTFNLLHSRYTLCTFRHTHTHTRATETKIISQIT